jgi:hypothetical protein
MILAVIVVVATAETALARPKKHRVDRGSAKGTGGAPANHSARQRHLYAAGPSVPSAIVSQPSAGVCKPPPINRFSDRVTQRIHSFPLNAGLGNNPIRTFT